MGVCSSKNNNKSHSEKERKVKTSYESCAILQQVERKPINGNVTFAGIPLFDLATN
jgi:hypothetical protein